MYFAIISLGGSCMTYQEILSNALRLSDVERKHLIGTLEQSVSQMESKSLDKISSALHINKKNAFDWRHKILGSLRQDEGKSFLGITESDETMIVNIFLQKE